MNNWETDTETGLHEDALTRQRRMRVKCTRETCLSIWESVAMNSNKENDCTQEYTQDFWLAGVNMAPRQLNVTVCVIFWWLFLVIMASCVTFVVTECTNKTCHESMTIGEACPLVPLNTPWLHQANSCLRVTKLPLSASIVMYRRYYRGTVHHYSFTLGGQSALKSGVINPVRRRITRRSISFAFHWAVDSHCCWTWSVKAKGCHEFFSRQLGELYVLHV